MTGKSAADSAAAKQEEAEQAKADASRKAAEHAALMRSEDERFTQLYEQQILPEKQKPENQYKRTGWTQEIEGYEILCCGNSAVDLLIITVLFLILYLFVGLFWWAMFEAYRSSTDTDAYLYTCAVLLALGWATLWGTAWTGQRHRAAEEEAEMKAAAQKSA